MAFGKLKTKIKAYKEQQKALREVYKAEAAKAKAMKAKAMKAEEKRRYAKIVAETKKRAREDVKKGKFARYAKVAKKIGKNIQKVQPGSMFNDESSYGTADYFGGGGSSKRRKKKSRGDPFDLGF